MRPPERINRNLSITSTLRPIAGNTRGKLCFNLKYRGFVTRVMSNQGNGAPRCGGPSEMSISCCMCEPLEIAPSLDENTHAVVTATVGTRARDTHEVWSSASVGCKPSSTCARTRKRAEVKARPRPLVNVNRREDSQTRQDDTVGVYMYETFWK